MSLLIESVCGQLSSTIWCHVLRLHMNYRRFSAIVIGIGLCRAHDVSGGAGVIDGGDTMAIVAPAAGAEIEAGSVFNIVWTADPRIQPYSFDLWNADCGCWSHIGSSTLAQGSINWPVPENLRGKRFRIRISSHGGTSMSSGYFKIVTMDGQSGPGSRKGSHSDLKRRRGKLVPSLR